jgi:hypothetical protein
MKSKILYLLSTLLENIFPKYKSQQWYTHASKPTDRWFIRKRFLIFFYRYLVFAKIVIYKAGNASSSNEILMFDSKEEAENEVDRLGFGYPPVKTIVYYNGKIKETTYHD